ncbi:M56 family metallopeptidase [Flagellimonas sp. 2504JD4-2]
MLEYILKSTACLTILFLFYKIFLEKESAHIFKRFYLLGALVLSSIIPLLVFVEYVSIADPHEMDILNASGSSDLLGAGLGTQDSNLQSLNFATILWSIYCVGLLLFGIKFIQNLAQTLRRIQRNPKQRFERCTHVLMQEKLPPHTFFRFIFLNKHELKSNKIPHEVLVHEEAHVVQKHSWDVIFIELLHLMLWFNPLMILFKRAIKLNHEFLADQAVLAKNMDTSTYQNTLLAFSISDNSKQFQPALSNAINYSSIKKRLTVMKTKTSSRSMLIRSLLLLPLCSLLLYGFADKKTILKTNAEEISKSSVTPQQKRAVNAYKSLSNEYLKDLELFLSENRHDNSDLKKQKTRIDRLFSSIPAELKEKFDLKELPPVPKAKRIIQQSATRKEMAEYNKLAKYYNDMPKNNMRIKSRDVARLTYIYNIMSEKQRKDAEPFPNFPEPPPPPKAPSSTEIKEAVPPKPPKPSKDEVREVAPQPPIPPAPKSPVEHIKEIAKKGAVFYYEGNQISAEKAINIVESNKSLNIDSRSDSKNGKPMVKISKDPIVIN